MPQFFTPSGIACTADEAKVGGRLRAGFREVVSDGEYVPFTLSMRDAMRSGSVFLTDSQQTVADQIAAAGQRAEAAYQQSKTRMNDWRNDPSLKAAEEARNVVRDARYS